MKYDLNKDSGAIHVDRFLHTAMYDPFNSGSIPHTRSKGGDPADAAVVSQVSVTPGVIIRSRPIRNRIREDEARTGEKTRSVHADDLIPVYANVGSYCQRPPILREQIVHIFGHDSSLEQGKWAEVKRRGEPEAAFGIVRAVVPRATDSKNEAGLDVSGSEP